MDPEQILRNAADGVQPYVSRGIKECTDGIFNQPFMFSRTLTSIGYEPFPPVEGSLFGVKFLWLPNIVQNMNYLRSVDGISGLYRGLLPSLFRRFTISTVSMALSIRIPKPIPRFDQIEQISTVSGLKTRAKGFSYFFRTFWWEYICQVGGLVISHPFKVIAVRSMAQFVGRESVYSTVIGAFKEIYKSAGFKGFFIGLVPVLLHSFVRLAAYYLLDLRKWGWKSYYTPFETYLYTDAANEIGTWLAYPFEVSANTMIVNNCGLLIGQPPHAPVYSTWLNVWKYLNESGLLYRGLWNFGRTYSGPIKEVDGHLQPVDFTFGPVHRPGGDSFYKGEDSAPNSKPSANLLRMIFFIFPKPTN